MKRLALICSTALFSLATAATILWFISSRSDIKLQCMGELLSRKNINNEESVTIRTNLLINLYNNRHGMILQKGGLTLGDKVYRIDREIKFQMWDLDNKGIYIIDDVNIKPSALDNVPKSIEEKYVLQIDGKSKQYIEIGKLKNQYIITMISSPFLICKRY